MGLYDDLAADAGAIIDEFGGDVLIERSGSPGDYHDPLKPWLGRAPGVATVPARAAIVPVEERRINGTSIRAGDGVAYIGGAALDPPLSVGDVIIAGGVRRRVESIEKISPDSVTLVLVEAIVR